MPQPARWNGALGHSPSPAHLVAVIRFEFLNIGRINRRPDVTSNCVLKLAGPKAGRCIGLAKRLGTKCCPRARRVISAEVSAQLLQALLDLLHCDPPSLVPTDSPSTLPAGELRPRIKCGALKLSRDRATQTDTNLLCFAGIGNLTARAALVAASCSVVWGFGFRRTGLWARPRPGALVGTLVMPKERQNKTNANRPRAKNWFFSKK